MWDRMGDYVVARFSKSISVLSVVICKVDKISDLYLVIQLTCFKIPK